MTDSKYTNSADRGGVSIGVANAPVKVETKILPSQLTDSQKKQAESNYLRRLMSDCKKLQWLSLVELEDQNTEVVGLDSVYTSLMTHSVLADLSISDDLVEQGNREQYVSAIEVLNANAKLVLTGDAGSGKSTLVAMLAIHMAGEKLGDTWNNLNALIEPLPDNNGDDQTGDDKKPIKQTWSHGALTPLRIILRDFAASDFFPVDSRSADCNCFLGFLKDRLTESACADYFTVLFENLSGGNVLVMFDGLDEVSDAGDQRSLLLECIHGFTSTFSGCRYVVTCRPYAYQHQGCNLDGFKSTSIADFNIGQINRFVQRWYAQMQELNIADQDRRQRKLRDALKDRPSLLKLARRPLLLSLIAYLDARRFSLPDKRADLYGKLYELLVNTWEKARFDVKDAVEAADLNQLSLAEYLKVDKNAIDHVLERLAFVAHAESSPQDQGTSDIPGKELINELVHAPDPGTREIQHDKLKEYLRDRVGILHQRSGDTEVDAIYAFPHRSFQEYLAARYVRRSHNRLYELFNAPPLKPEREKWEYLAANLARHQPDRWREVILLCGGIDAQTDPDSVWDLLEQLTEHKDKSKASLSLPEAWGCRLALEIIHENVYTNKLETKKFQEENLKNYQQDLIRNLQQLLPALLAHPQLPAAERAAAALYCNSIGDTRPEVCDIDQMVFCFVPKGEFVLGNDDKEFFSFDEEGPEVAFLINYDYWISKHPVSVAHYKQFLEENAEAEQSQRISSNLNNMPVVEISWEQATAFCKWLTVRWRTTGLINENLQVILPSEPEWEKAAKGGMLIPASAVEVPVCRVDESGIAGTDTMDNPAPRRQYPWLDTASSQQGQLNEDSDDLVERFNHAMKIKRTNAAGVFPSGESPYGCQDLSGNVWEWTRSVNADYPYPPIGSSAYRQREDIDIQDKSVARVLRGGAFYDVGRSARCSFRDHNRPGNRDSNIGFRCVLSPLL